MSKREYSFIIRFIMELKDASYQPQNELITIAVNARIQLSTYDHYTIKPQ